jgi:hypothetical protein
MCHGEDECLTHNGTAQVRRAEVESCLCCSVCFWEPYTLARNKALKVSFICSSVSLLAPAFMTLSTQNRGQEAFGKTDTKQAISCSKLRPGLTFCEIYSREGFFFIGLVLKHDLCFFFFFLESPSC